MLRPVLTENPQQRDARRLQRAIDEQAGQAGDRHAAAASPPARSRSRSSCATCTLRNVFELLQRATGINFVFDKDVRADQRTTILLRDASIEDVIRLVLLTNQLEQKVLNENTVLIYPNTPQKLREYQELVVKSFYLANADVKQTANMIRTLVKTRDIFIDEKLNLLVIKDTPGGDPPGRAADRGAGPGRARGDARGRGAGGRLEPAAAARHPLPRPVAWSLVGAAGMPGQVTLPEWLNRGSELVRLQLHRPAVPAQPASSRTAPPACSPTRASA